MTSEKGRSLFQGCSEGQTLSFDSFRRINSAIGKHDSVGVDLVIPPSHGFEPLSTRRNLLTQVLKKAAENIRLSGELRGTKEELLRVAQEFGLEGLVAKKPNSVYESGRRSGAWVKFKITKSQEFVIGGYTLPEGSRSHFGSLLVGYNSADGLVFAGRVGTGFSEKLLAKSLQ
jgi:ATP-dependent DNA ligase